MQIQPLCVLIRQFQVHLVVAVILLFLVILADLSGFEGAQRWLQLIDEGGALVRLRERGVCRTFVFGHG